MPRTITRRSSVYFGSSRVRYNYIANETIGEYVPLFSNDLRFGIEFEANINSSDKVELASWLSANFNTWRIGDDCSLRPAHDQYRDGTMEMRTPPLQGPQALKDVRKVLKKTAALNSGVNASCGTHVHIDATRWYRNAQNVEIYRRLGNIMRGYQYFEPVFDGLMCRERNSAGYASSLANLRFISSPMIKSSGDFLGGFGPRTAKCNLTTALQSHNTIEFRQHSGTLNFGKIISWMILMQLFVRRTMSESEVNFLQYPTTLSGLYDYLQIQESDDALINKVKELMNERYERYGLAREGRRQERANAAASNSASA